MPKSGRSRPHSAGCAAGAAVLLILGCSRAETIDVRSAAAARPEIVNLHQPTTRVDLGRVEAGATRQRILRLANRRADPFRLTAVHSTCGCVRLEGVPQVVAPGASIDCQLTYRAGLAAANEVRAVRLHLEGAAHAHVIQILAQVRPEFAVIPAELALGSVTAGDHVRRTATIGNFSAADWPDVEVLNASGWTVRQRLLPAGAPADAILDGARQVFALELERTFGSADIGRAEGRLTVAAAGLPLLTGALRYQAQILHPVTARPAAWLIRRHELRDQAAVLLTPEFVDRKTGARLSVRHVAVAESPDITVALEGQSPDEQRLLCSLIDRTRSETLPASLVVQVNFADAAYPPVRFPIVILPGGT